MMQAGLQAPLLAFLPDDDVFPFDDVGHLCRKSGWLADGDRHVGVEIVDSAERRWVISGLMWVEPERRRWWQFGRPAEAQREIEIEPLDPQPFAETRRRVEDQASRIFAEDDDALADIRSAETMADLGKACFQITVRAQGLRILAGDLAVRMRTPLEVARRVLVLFAMVRISLGGDRIDTIEWLKNNDLLGAISPHEGELLGMWRRWTGKQRSDVGWNVEGLVVLLWALGLADLPPDGEFADISIILDIMPPTSETDLATFLETATLRPAAELAATAEDFRERLRRADEEYASSGSDDDANAALALDHRYGTTEWLLNPDRLEWE